MKTEDEYALDLFKGASQLGRDTVAAAKALPSEVVGLADGVVQATATVAANALESFNKAVGGIIGVFQQKMQNDAQQLQNEHQLHMAHEQRLLLEKAADTAKAAYDSKLQFFQSQLQSIEQTYQRHAEILNADLQQLQEKKAASFADMSTYMAVSKAIRTKTEALEALQRNYNEAHRNISDAVKILRLENPLAASGQLLLPPQEE